MKTQLWARLQRGENSFPRLVGGDPSGPRSRITIAWRCLAVFASLGVLGTGLAEGAVGDRVRTVNLPPEVGCRVEGVADHVAISVAVVPRTVLGIAGERALLATSCRSASGATIYFIDPGPPDRTVSEFAGTVVHTLETKMAGRAFSPPNGWGSFAFRGDVSPQDMLACSNPARDAEPHRIYSIDLRTGEAQELFAAAMPTPGKPYCDGLAWDPANDTIYMSSDVSDTVNHYAPTGGLIRTLTVPSGCFVAGVSGNSGIVVVGPNLFLACNGDARIFEVRQSDGTVVRSFSSGAERAEDLECDRTTFGPDLSVAWTKDAFQPRFISLETPPGSCGLCRSDQRRDLNSLSAGEQADLAALLEEYLTGLIVGVHRQNIAPWHGPGQLFFPGHRGYIAGFEIWLLNVKGRPEFVPLPKWDPANPIPPAFQPVDTAACTTSGAPGANCSGIVNSNISSPLPASFVFSGPPPTTSGLCAYTSIRELQVGGGGRPDLESDYHGGRVHCGIGGTMCDINVSPSALVFKPWHAFIDDVGLQYESACRGSVPGCVDIFTPFTASRSAARRASGASVGEPVHLTAPLGFWWWFEDIVTPPEVSPAFVVDHSGFNFKGRVRGKATLVPGLVGQALQLDGRNDFVEVRDRTVGEAGSSDFTLDAWIKTGADGIQPIIDKRSPRGTGYALFLKDGLLVFHLGTYRGQRVFTAQTRPVGDNQWHHVAAVVSRHHAKGGAEEEGDASALFVDGEVVLQFDATALADDATSNSRLWIGRSRSLAGDDDADADDDAHPSHSSNGELFNGELDEIDLFRSTLSRDLVASIFIAGSAGKFGSLGNLPTSAGRPPCLVELGEMIAAVPKAAALAPFYDQVLEALGQGKKGQARQSLRDLRDKALEMAGEPTFLNMQLHAIHHHSDACLQQRDLEAAAGIRATQP